MALFGRSHFASFVPHYAKYSRLASFPLRFLDQLIAGLFKELDFRLEFYWFVMLKLIAHRSHVLSANA